MKQISDEVFAQVRDAICVAESLTERSLHHPKILAALAALDTAQPEPLITVESSLRFRLESEKQKSDDLLDEVRELKGKLLQAQSVHVNAVLLSEMQIATLINKHFYVGMAPDYSHYKAFALGVLTAAKQSQPERAPSDAFLQMAIISFGLLIQGDFDLPENAQELAKRAVPLMESVLHDDDDPITIVFAAIAAAIKQGGQHE